MEQQEYEPGKIFVGGLSWETQEAGMRAYFEQFGKVADCVVMRDPLQPDGMKRNRGFGFVKFEDPSTVEKVVQHPIHTLDNKTIDPKKAQSKGGLGGGGNHERKVFLGGLASNTTEQDVKDYFTRLYGNVITDVDFKIDKSTNRMRGFGFVEFESVAVREKVVQTCFHDICGKRVEAKRAEPRHGTSNAMQQANVGMSAAYQAYQQPYPQGDYRSAANGQQYPQYYGGGGGGQGFYPPYGTPAQTGYGQQYSSGPPNYSYDQSAYPRTQTSTGDRQDSQTPYYQHANPYGHTATQQLAAATQQLAAATYGQDASSYTGRTSYGGGQDSYGQQMAGYGSGTSQQQQAHYGAGAGSYGR